MSAHGGKSDSVRKVNQNELRRLMKAKASEIKSSGRNKIDSPFARYNSVGQLYCTICTTQIKSDILWTAHVNGRTHKESVHALKTQSDSPVDRKTQITNPPSTVKRKSSDLIELVQQKKQKSIVVPESKPRSSVQVDFFDSSAKPKSGITQNLISTYSDSEGEEETKELIKNVGKSTLTAAQRTVLPSDFFGNNENNEEVHDSAEDNLAVSIKVTKTEDLPEGFFDDPVLDAKVRKVELKDPLQDEWESFQKAIKEESHVSEAIIEEDTEINMAERQIEEIDEQMAGWQKIEALEKKQDEMKAKIQSKVTQPAGNMEDVGDVNEDDLDTMFDWKSKGVWH